MAKLQECAAAVVKAAKGKITNDQAKELILEMVNEINKPMPAIDPAGKTIDQIIKESANNTKLKNALQRRAAIAMVSRRRINMAHIAQFDKAGEGFKSLFVGSRANIKGARTSVDSLMNTLEKEYLGRLKSALTEIDGLAEFKSKDFEQDILRELHFVRDTAKSGYTGNKKAIHIAKAIAGLHDDMVPRLNRAGGFIKQLDTYTMHQTHNEHRIRSLGGRGNDPAQHARSFKAWRDYAKPLIDPKTYGAMNPDEWLKAAHADILSGVYNKDTIRLDEDFKKVGSLAKKVSEPRLIHFKGPDEFYKYNKAFGSTNVKDGIMNDMRRMAHNTAIMEILGPNPEAMVNRIERELLEKYKNNKKQLNSIRRKANRDSFEQVMGRLDIPVNQLGAGIVQALNVGQSLAKLGATTASAVPDKGLMHMAGTFQGMAHLDIMLEQFKLFAPMTKEHRGYLELAGAGIDGFLGEVHTRFLDSAGAPRVLLKLQQTMFKLNFMNWWNDVHKMGFMKLQASWLAKNAPNPLSSINPDLRNALNLYGIDDLDWDIMRRYVKKIGDHDYLTPDNLKITDTDAKNLLSRDGVKKLNADNLQRAKDQLTTKLRTFLVDQIDDAVVTPGGNERRLAKFGTQAGTVPGGVARLLMHFKSFPVSVFERVIKKEIYSRGPGSAAAWLRSPKSMWRMTQLIAMTTVGGYISGVIKDRLKGRTAKRLINDDGSVNTTVAFDAMMRGGGLSIYGDLLFEEYDRSYNDALSVIAGPTIGQLPEIMAMKTDLMAGKDITGPLENLAKNNTPFANLIWLKPALDYMIFWNLQEFARPGSLTKMERKIEDENHQSFWLKPSRNAKLGFRSPVLENN